MSWVRSTSTMMSTGGAATHSEKRPRAQPGKQRRTCAWPARQLLTSTSSTAFASQKPSPSQALRSSPNAQVRSQSAKRRPQRPHASASSERSPGVQGPSPRHGPRSQKPFTQRIVVMPQSPQGRSSTSPSRLHGIAPSGGGTAASTAASGTAPSGGAAAEPAASVPASVAQAAVRAASRNERSEDTRGAYRLGWPSARPTCSGGTARPRRKAPSSARRACSASWPP